VGAENMASGRGAGTAVAVRLIVGGVPKGLPSMACLEAGGLPRTMSAREAGLRSTAHGEQQSS
jgi:hypothetical protein